MVNLPYLRSYSPHPLDASFVVATAAFSFAGVRFQTLSKVQLAGAVITGLACAALGALRFINEKALESLKGQILLAFSMHDWDVIPNPQIELKRYGEAIENMSKARLCNLEATFKRKKPLAPDQFHTALWEASENHPGASHFYRYLKGAIYRNLSGILPLASGSVARTFTTTADYVSAFSRAGASIPVVGPFLSAAGSGFSYATNASEVSYYQKVAQLFTEPMDLDFFIRWVALHYTKTCAKHLPYLDEDASKQLAEKIATCVLAHLVYKHSKDSKGEEGPFDLLQEAKAVVQGLDWSSYQGTTFYAKEALHSIIKIINLAEILGLKS